MRMWACRETVGHVADYIAVAAIGKGAAQCALAALAFVSGQAVTLWCG